MDRLLGVLTLSAALFARPVPIVAAETMVDTPEPGV